ncbi:LuxR C-terminal-related transcriptional regulator [Herbiconiux sp. A18JL235]|uniref:LuxR C-terminal-related transcriptional regulator n=1 Tax=Herbiconiux sp. A18JL235 TaxID=3152363 RepID=A0AB39BKQ7_9MICO
MTTNTMRPDDRELVRQATRSLWRGMDAAVAFGGLRTEHSVPITTSFGAQTDRLQSIVVRNSRGLGGLSWQTRAPRVVSDYALAGDITHDFDSQILGEGITALAVAPIVVGTQVRGLLYAGRRGSDDDRSGEFDTTRLAGVASAVAQELRLRDLVDERVAMQQAQAAQAELAARAAEAERPSAQLRERLARVADRTSDPNTARELRAILAPRPAVAAEGALTERQRDVLELVACGLTNPQIATRLGLSELTVKSYLRALMARLGAGTRMQAVLFAQQRGLL